MKRKKRKQKHSGDYENKKDETKEYREGRGDEEEKRGIKCKKTKDKNKKKEYGGIIDKETGEITEWERKTIRLGENRYKIIEGEIEEEEEWKVEYKRNEAGEKDEEKIIIKTNNKKEEREEIMAIGEKIGKWENPREKKPTHMEEEEHTRIRLAQTKTIIKWLRKMEKSEKEEDEEKYTYMKSIVEFDKEEQKGERRKRNLEKTKKE